MQPSYKILQKAYELYFNRSGIAYLYGCKGDVIRSREQFDRYIAAEPEYFNKRYDARQLDEIYEFCLGKVCGDCSWFVGTCVDDPIWSGGLWDHCNKKTSVAQCKAGSVLYKDGHVGIDLGSSACMHITREMQTIKIEPNYALGFLGGGEHRNFDYSEASNH